MTAPPDELLARWSGMHAVDGVESFDLTLQRAFGLAPDDAYTYRAEGIATTLAHVQARLDDANLRYTYTMGHGAFEVSVYWWRRRG
jgi:hypothetical protein